MVFLFSILAQWFSRGVFIQLCLQQEQKVFLSIIFGVAIFLGSPIQGYMSDMTSRKKAAKQSHASRAILRRPWLQMAM